LPDLVINRRGELGLTQAELAAQIGTTTSTISRIESG
jgi:transcriptional regulator with XRE-family HTH domain